MAQTLPAQPDIDWLKKTAKQRLAELRVSNPAAKLHQAQLAIARDYGFKSWRALKVHIAHIESNMTADHDRERVFEAARVGDVEAVRRALASGFDPMTPDDGGRTIYQIAKERRHEAIELLARDIQARSTRPEAEARAIRAIISAAQSGNVTELRARLDAHPELIDALGGGIKKATALHLAVLRNRHAAVRLRAPTSTVKATTTRSAYSAGRLASDKCAKTWPPICSPMAHS
jgi:hypothetical protein